MTAHNSARLVSPSSIGNLRDWLDLLAALRNFNQPISSPDGLRQAIAIALRIAATAGLDAAWLARVQSLLDDPNVFEIVLAIERYLLTLIATKSPTTGNPQPGSDVTVQSLSLGDWLSIFTELLQIIGKLRAAI